MRSVKVTFDDGDWIYSKINATDEEILRYYLGNKFNLGNGPYDRIVTAVLVEFLEPRSGVLVKCDIGVANCT